jgi:ABC-type Fe3+-siderophore transport system permease subunit
MDTLIAILGLFGLPMVTTIPVTALLCRYRIKSKKHISFWMTLLGCGLSAVLTTFVGCLISDGSKVLSVGYWMGEDIGLDGWLTYWFYATCICLVPALCVVAYYKKQSRRDDIPVA